MSKKTIVIGASTNPERYAYKAILALARHDHEVIPIGLKEGEVAGISILTGFPAIDQVDTVTLYVGPKNQPVYYDYILSLKPKRLILNPGTENMQLEKLAEANGIEALEACTLVLLATNQY